jgi:prepilin-type N-terminal cleavage/methylation domain-containing protein/prepilin-type processing-associated H-X9-DG protein
VLLGQRRGELAGRGTGLGGGSGGRGAGGAGRGGRRGYTLVELLVSIAIIAMLVAILLPTLGYTIRSARGFRCQMSLRSVAFDFSVFADDQLHGDRGHDARDLGRGRFRLETFQESQYGLDEFWRWQGASTHQFPDVSNNDPMRCSEVKGLITLQNNTPCSQGAVTPARNISYTFNGRLDRAERTLPTGASVPMPVTMTGEILQHGRVPLVWDVDGETAQARGLTPVFSAPGVNPGGFYSSNQYWFPSRRHNGGTNFAFVDGSVAASARPLQAGWDWSYQPPR